MCNFHYIEGRTSNFSIIDIISENTIREKKTKQRGVVECGLGTDVSKEIRKQGNLFSREGERESRSKKRSLRNIPPIILGKQLSKPAEFRHYSTIPYIAYAKKLVTFVMTFLMGPFHDPPSFAGPASPCSPPSAMSASSVAGAVVVAISFSFSLPMALSFPLFFPNKWERELNFSFVVRRRDGATSTKNTD